MEVLFIGIPIILFVSIILSRFRFNSRETDELIQKNNLDRIRDLYQQR